MTIYKLFKSSKHDQKQVELLAGKQFIAIQEHVSRMTGGRQAVLKKISTQSRKE